MSYTRHTCIGTKCSYNFQPVTRSVNMVSSAQFIPIIVRSGHVLHPSSDVCQNYWTMRPSFCYKNKKTKKIKCLCHCQKKKVCYEPLLSRWPTYWEWNAEILRLWNALTTKHHQLKAGIGVFCLILLLSLVHLIIFFTIFGILTTFAVRWNFTNFPSSSACCNLRGRLVLLFASSKHVLLREIAQSLQASTPSHRRKRRVLTKSFNRKHHFFFKVNSHHISSFHMLPHRVGVRDDVPVTIFMLSLIRCAFYSRQYPWISVVEDRLKELWLLIFRLPCNSLAPRSAAMPDQQ